MATLSEIRHSEWAKSFLKEAPGQYVTAIDYACDPDMTYRIIEQDDYNYPAFILVPAVDYGFGMATSDDYDELADLCVKMGWRYAYG